MDNILHDLFTFFEKMPRQGPGSIKLTNNLLQKFFHLLPPNPIGADMGSGSGAATLVLAEKAISVTAVDVHKPFLDELMRKASERKLDHLITPVVASMTDTKIAENSLDIIWSEGALFTVGLENALKYFSSILKKGGVLGFSDCFLFQKDTPDNVIAQWKEWDSNIKTVPDALKIAEGLGYRFLHAEAVTPEMWEESYFGPMEKVIESIEADKNSSAGLLERARINRKEAKFFRENNAYYGYMFLILQKI